MVTSQKIKSIRKPKLVYFIWFCCFSYCLLALWFGWIGLEIKRAELMLDRAANGEPSNDLMVDLKRQQALLSSSGRYMPHALHLAATISEVRGYWGNQASDAGYLEAISLYRQAIALRPYWADTYGRLAIALIVVGRRGEEVREVLASADAFGSYTPGVHEAIVYAYLADYSLVSREVFEHHLFYGAANTLSSKKIDETLAMFNARYACNLDSRVSRLSFCKSF